MYNSNLSVYLLETNKWYISKSFENCDNYFKKSLLFNLYILQHYWVNALNGNRSSIKNANYPKH